MPRLALKRPVGKSFTRPCGRVVPPNHIPKQIHRLRRLHRLDSGQEQQQEQERLSR